jgi:hypothetical protein
MKKSIAIGIGVVVAIAITAYAVTNEFSFEKTKETGEKTSVNSTAGKNKTYDISVSETVGLKSAP